MFTLPEIEALQAEKKILQQQSSINRQLLAMEWLQFKSKLTSYRPGLPVSAAAGRWAMVVAPILGFLMVRRLRFARGMWLKGLVLWQLAQRMRKGWIFLRRFF